MIKQNFELEVLDNNLRISGDVGFSDLGLLESKILNIINNGNVAKIEFMVTFDSSLVVLICSLIHFMRTKSINLVWALPKKLIMLLKLYGVEQYFYEEKNEIQIIG